MISEQQLLTVKDLASQLRLSLTETYRLVQSGAIIHFRVGPGKGAIRIRQEDVTAFLENRRIGAKAPEPVRALRNKPLKHIRTK